MPLQLKYLLTSKKYLFIFNTRMECNRNTKDLYIHISHIKNKTKTKHRLIKFRRNRIKCLTILYYSSASIVIAFCNLKKNVLCMDVRLAGS